MARIEITQELQNKFVNSILRANELTLGAPFNYLYEVGAEPITRQFKATDNMLMTNPQHKKKIHLYQNKILYDTVNEAYIIRFALT